MVCVYLVGACFNHYLSKDIEDFSHLQMTQLEDMLQMYESQEQKALKKAENWLEAKYAKYNKEKCSLTLSFKKEKNYCTRTGWRWSILTFHVKKKKKRPSFLASHDFHMTQKKVLLGRNNRTWTEFMEI